MAVVKFRIPGPGSGKNNRNDLPDMDEDRDDQGEDGGTGEDAEPGKTDTRRRNRKTAGIPRMPKIRTGIPKMNTKKSLLPMSERSGDAHAPKIKRARKNVLHGNRRSFFCSGS
jgi:hypothetical protein